MERSEYQVESPPQPPRKERRRAVTDRERGIEVACRNGLFVMPRDAFDNSPMVVALCELSVSNYNMTADLKLMKRSCESELEATEGRMRLLMQDVCIDLNKIIRKLRTLGFEYRNHILEVEGGNPVNEPSNWARG